MESRYSPLQSMLKVAWSSVYAHSLPEGHRFPMEKYDLIPQQLLHEGTLTEDQFFEPLPQRIEDILEAHDAAYVERLLHGTVSAKEMRRIGFPYSPALIHRERVINQGTLDCARHALLHGAGMNVSGGTHHAYADRGEGFCLLNDIATAVKVLLRDGNITKALIVDLDVHQGNGTAAILANEPRAYTFSMHCAGNFPMEKETSDRDIALPPGTDDATFLGILLAELPRLLQEIQPDILFYLSGVDILATDKLGRFKMSREGCKERDRIVLDAAYRLGIPLCASMGGGYSTHIRDIVEAHCNTFRLAAARWA